MNYFQNLLSVECTTEQKGKLTYVSWIEAWTRLKAVHPGATYEVHQTPDGSFMHGEGFVMCSVTVPDALGDGDAGTCEDVTHTMWLPVMDMKNAQIKTPSSTDINKALMRCLAKCVAMHGLGSYVYMGEDLPVMSAEPAPSPPAPKVAENYQQKLTEMQTWAGEPRPADKIQALRDKVAGWPAPWGAMAADALDAVEVAP